MKLERTIERARRDWKVLLRTPPAACITIGGLAVLLTCTLVPVIADDTEAQVHCVLLLTFALSVLGYWWSEKNRGFATEIRRAIFDIGRKQNDLASRKAWYAKALKWLSENHLLGENANTLFWPWDTLRAIEMLEPALKRRAEGREHCEILALYKDEPEDKQDELRKDLDAREELPSNFEGRRFSQDFCGRVTVFPLMLFALIYLVLGILPPALNNVSLPREATQRELFSSAPANHDDREEPRGSPNAHNQ